MNFEVWVSQTPMPPLSVGEIASDWPHQVIVKAYLCTGKRFYDQRKFCERLTLCRNIGSVRISDHLYRIFRFKERHHAQQFGDEFDGVRYLPFPASAKAD
jgi:hypothetical protein